MHARFYGGNLISARATDLQHHLNKVAAHAVSLLVYSTI
jgi:hypothetical protein